MQVTGSAARWLLALGLGLGWTCSALSACLVPDYCIEVYSPGTDWCVVLDGARMWPNGQPELSVPVYDNYGGPPTGCLCFNDADQAILGDQTPAIQYEYLTALIQSAARKECNSFVPLGYDSNCYIADGDGASVPQQIFANGPSYECKGECAFANPPPLGDCPEKNPYECNDDEYGNDEVHDADATTDDSGTESSSGDISPDLQRSPG